MDGDWWTARVEPVQQRRGCGGTMAVTHWRNNRDRGWECCKEVVTGRKTGDGVESGLQGTRTRRQDSSRKTAGERMGSSPIWIRMDHGVLARRNSGGLSGESPLIRAAPQKLLIHPRALVSADSAVPPGTPCLTGQECHLPSTTLSPPVVDPPCFPGTGASLVFL